MAHCAKYPASACGHMLNHYGRSEDKERSAYVARSNDKIDPERTHLNYNLGPDRGMSQLDFIHQRLGEVRVQKKRADVNIICDWVVTFPKKYEVKGRGVNINGYYVIPNEAYVKEKFFQATYDFLKQKYGEKNVVSAYVHRDETSDHMHFCFMPIVKDQKNGGEKLCAKEAVTRKDLKTFHTELERTLERRTGIRFEVLNEATKEGNKSIAELKRGTAIEEQQRQQAKIQELAAEVERTKELEKERKKAAEAELKELERKKEGLLTSIEVADLKGKKALGGGLKGVTFTEYEALKRTAAEVDAVKAENKELAKKLDDAEWKVKSTEYLVNSARASGYEQGKADAQRILDNKEAAHAKELRSVTSTKNETIIALRDEIKELRRDKERLEKAVTFLKSFIWERLPAALAKVEQQVKQILHPAQSQAHER